MLNFDKTKLISKEDALPGRDTPMPVPAEHFVNHHPMQQKWQEPLHVIDFAMGCFWGAERVFWQIPGVYVTAVGYAGGYTPNPTYDEVCSGQTGHTETVRVVFDSEKVSLKILLQHFWEEHDPTQFMYQGNDRGSNYRSAIFVHSKQDYETAVKSRLFYAQRLRQEQQGSDDAASQADTTAYAPIVTEIHQNVPFYYAEEYHQQYLAKNPNGYCGLKGTGVSCPIG